jgi:hypothetical protein
MKKGDRVLIRPNIKGIVLKVGEVREVRHGLPDNSEPYGQPFLYQDILISYIHPITGKLTKGLFNINDCSLDQI